MIILETERLTLREISLNDIQELSKILQNPKSMLPWHELFTNQELCTRRYYFYINDITWVIIYLVYYKL